MTSIYQQCMGKEFNQLHPKIQKRFGFASGDSMAAIGTGIMEEIWVGRFYTRPFLAIGTWRNIMFPAYGKAIPFCIENYAYCDQYGRETVTWNRTFHFPNRSRRFDATMIYSQQRKRIVDYLGTHQHLAVDIDLSVAENGGIQLHSGEQRFYEGRIGFRFPMFFSGYAEVCEWYDDTIDKFRIQVVVSNRRWGKLFGYHGYFEVNYVAVEKAPAAVRPVREEWRE
jgi:Domain of unknown function (DUF4166)